MCTVTGFRPDGTPLLVRWPTNPYAMTKAESLPSFIPKTLVEACQVLGIELDADEDTIKRVGDALRIANHPDHARDEADRQRREARSKQINAALDLLSGKRRAA
jgi:preprotein translocase subunit Sec63